MYSGKAFWGSIAAAVILCALAFYLTPLKNFDLVQPTMHEIDPLAFSKAFTADPNSYIAIDVRTAAEYDAGHVPGSVNIPAAELYNARGSLPRSGKTIVLICGDGRLAAIAYGYLAYYGFTNIEHMTGGVQQWITEGLSVATSASTAASTTPTD